MKRPIVVLSIIPSLAVVVSGIPVSPALGQSTSNGNMAVTITMPDNTTYTVTQAGATRLGDFVGPNFTQQNYVSCIGALFLCVYFRPDSIGPKREVVFELGKTDPAGDPNLTTTLTVMYNATPYNGKTWAYQATITDSGTGLNVTQNVPNHWWGARWRFKTADRPILNTPSQIVTNYGVLPYAIPAGTAIPSPLNPASYTYVNPMDSAGIDRSMGDTGDDRPDIGVHTGWSAAWMLNPTTGTNSNEQMMRQTCEANGSIPWHYRDTATNAPVSLATYPRANFYPTIGGQGAPSLLNAQDKLRALVPGYTQFTGSISGTTLTVSAIISGGIFVGDNVSDSQVNYRTTSASYKDGVVVPVGGATVTAQLTGTTNGVGTYTVNTSQTVTSRTMYGSNNQGTTLYYPPESGWSLANNHAPMLCQIAFFATGDPYFLEEVQFTSFQNYAGSVTLDGSGNAVPFPNEPRAFGWGVAAMEHARKATHVAAGWGTLPGWLNGTSYWDTLSTNALNYTATWTGNATYAGTVWHAMTWVNTILPWQQVYETAAYFQAVAYGYAEWTTVAGWIAYDSIQLNCGCSGWPQAYGWPYYIVLGPNLDVAGVDNPAAYTNADYYSSVAATWTGNSQGLGNGNQYVNQGQLSSAQLTALQSDPTNGGTPVGQSGWQSYLLEQWAALKLASSYNVTGATAAYNNVYGYLKSDFGASPGIMLEKWAFAPTGGGGGGGGGGTGNGVFGRFGRISYTPH